MKNNKDWIHKNQLREIINEVLSFDDKRERDIFIDEVTKLQKEKDFINDLIKE